MLRAPRRSPAGGASGPTRILTTSFRRFFEAIVEQCREAGLVWGKELYFDATQVDANASLGSMAPRFAVEAHLGELFTDDASDEPSPDAGNNQPVELPVPITESEREQVAQTTRSVTTGWPATVLPIGRSSGAPIAVAPTSMPAPPILMRRSWPSRRAGSV